MILDGTDRAHCQVEANCRESSRAGDALRLANAKGAVQDSRTLKGPMHRLPSVVPRLLTIAMGGAPEIPKAIERGDGPREDCAEGAQRI